MASPGAGSEMADPAAARGGTKGLGRLLTGLSDRAASRLESCIAVLDRQLDAVRAADTRAILELSQLETSLTTEYLAVEKTISRLEQDLRLQGSAEGSRVVAVERTRRDALREAVTERNRRNREVLAAEMQHTRRRIVLHRSRLGTPSPFASLGDAALLDIRT